MPQVFIHYFSGTIFTFGHLYFPNHGFDSFGWLGGQIHTFHLSNFRLGRCFHHGADSGALGSICDH